MPYYGPSSSEDESRLSSAIEIESGDVYYGPSSSEDESPLSPVIEAFHKKEAEIRLGLRRHGGHRGKVDNKVLVWLEEFEKIKSHISDLTKQPCKFLYSLSFLDLQKLINEVEFLMEEASSFQFIYDSDDVDRVQGVHPSQPLIGKLAQEISDQIWDCLMDPEIGMIALYGSGGVGKTTIMKNIKNQLTDTDIFDKIIWVTLSKKMDTKRVQEDIAKQLNIKLPVKSVWGYSREIVLQHLKTVKRCLIILDDVWQSVWLDELGIPEPGRNNGCKIVLTTRFRNLSANMSVDRWMHLSPLSENEAWELFVSRSGDHVLGSDINSFAKEVVNECGGLPLTVITVAHTMRNEVDLTAWERALTYLRKNVGRDNVLSLLQFGYDHLKNDQIRECFLYCALFPEDYKFDSNELIGYWMAEDFIHNENDVVRSYDEGLEILRYLKDASMLEMLVEGGNEQWQMHDLFRDLAIRIMRGAHSGFVRAGQGLSRFLIGEKMGWAKRISFVRNHIQRRLYVHNHDYTSALSTLLLKDNPLSQISDTFFSKMPNLQVIDMSFTGIRKLPSSLCALSRLRVLFLQYCTSLRKIPSLEKLRELRVLNLRGTLITELPHGMKDLVSLRSLDLSETVGLKYIRTGVLSALLNLEELHMQGSSLGKMQSKTVTKCFKEIRCLKKLGILSLSAVGFEDHLDTILFLQGYSLKRFSINVYGSSSDYVDDV